MKICNTKKTQKTIKTNQFDTLPYDRKTKQQCKSIPNPQYKTVHLSPCFKAHSHQAETKAKIVSDVCCSCSLSVSLVL